VLQSSFSICNLLEQDANRTGKPWQQRGLQRVSFEERHNVVQLRLIPPIQINRAKPPVYDPVFAHTAPGVELKLCFAITALVHTAERKDFNHQFGCFVELAVSPKSRFRSLAANPNDIWGNIVVLSKDEAGAKYALPSPFFLFQSLSSPNISAQTS